MNIKQQLIGLGTLVGGFTLGAGVLVALAQTTGWTAAPGTPPSSNVAAPLNVSSNTQTKTGLLGLANLLVSGTFSLYASTTPGQVLAALDNAGTVGWKTVSSGGDKLIGVAATGISTSASVAIPAGSTYAIIDVTGVEYGGGGDQSPGGGEIYVDLVHAKTSGQFTYTIDTANVAWNNASVPYSSPVVAVSLPSSTTITIYTATLNRGGAVFKFYSSN
jgi:hypothetical protein